MKCIYTGFILVVSLFWGCSKDSPIAPQRAVAEDSIPVNADTFKVSDTFDLNAPVICKYDFSQDSIHATANPWDMAIDGDMLFALEKDSIHYLLRKPGKFFIDKDGYLIREFNGPRLLGWEMVRDTMVVDEADWNAYKCGQQMGEIRLPLMGVYSPGRATTSVKLQGNLNSDNEPLGTVLYTRPFYHRVDEFNTNTITQVNTNKFGAWNPTGGPAGTGSAAHSAIYLTLSDLAIDAGLINSVKLTGIYDGNGSSLGIKYGDLLAVTATIKDNLGVDETQTGIFEVIHDPTQAAHVSAEVYRVSTLAQFLLAVQDFLTSTAWNGGAGSNAPNARLAIMPDGKIRVDNGSGNSILNLTFSSNRPISRTYVSNAFSLLSEIVADGYGDSPNSLLRPAVASDYLFDYSLYDNTWTPLLGSTPTPQIFTENGDLIDVEDDDVLNLSALVGSIPKNAQYFQVSDGITGTIHSATTMQNIMDYIRNVLNLPERDNTVHDNLSLSVDGVDTEDNLIPEGSIIIRGRPETLFSINNFSLLAGNAVPSSNPPTNFNANFVVTQLQAARSTGLADASIEVYDTTGTAHTFTVSFAHTGIKNPGTWTWTVSTSKGETVISGRSGRITFGLDGSPSSFTFDQDSVCRVSIDPGNGVPVIHVRLETGEPGFFSCITQWASPTTIAAVSQDGYAAGRLEEYTVDECGAIWGAFSNGVGKPLYKIAFARVPCEQGLREIGYGYFRETAYSGSTVFGDACHAFSGSIRSGALEGD